MQLSPEQIRTFDEQGFIFFPNCFRAEEVALLRDVAESILKLDRQEIWREKSGAPRTAFAAHTYSEVFGLLYRVARTEHVVHCWCRCVLAPRERRIVRDHGRASW